jgi:hypothetical protein
MARVTAVDEPATTELNAGEMRPEDWDGPARPTVPVPAN